MGRRWCVPSARRQKDAKPGSGANRERLLIDRLDPIVRGDVDHHFCAVGKALEEIPEHADAAVAHRAAPARNGCAANATTLRSKSIAIMWSRFEPRLEAHMVTSLANHHKPGKLRRAATRRQKRPHQLRPPEGHAPTH
jgi:hypothetical protein